MNTIPFAPHYKLAQETALELNWADLPTIDLADATTAAGREILAGRVAKAMEDYGFFYVVNHGITAEENARIFDIADVPFTAVSQEEKNRYLARIEERGSFQGYKLRQYWHIDEGVKDQTEVFSVHRDVTRREQPEPIKPFLPEIGAFAKHNHVHILHTLLRLFARTLELPEETLVKMHNFEGVSESYVRMMKYYPRSEEDEKRTQQVWLKGHTDIGSVTILWSQPVSALQILGRDKVWRWVKHVPNALVVNAGDALEALSGGKIQATIHRVVQPPPDQRNVPRLGVFYFAMADDDVRLASLVPTNSSSKDGNAENREAPTMREWREARTRAYGRTALSPNIKDAGVEEELINGVLVRHYK